MPASGPSSMPPVHGPGAARPGVFLGGCPLCVNLGSMQLQKYYLRESVSACAVYAACSGMYHKRLGDIPPIHNTCLHAIIFEFADVSEKDESCVQTQMCLPADQLEPAKVA